MKITKKEAAEFIAKSYLLSVAHRLSEHFNKLTGRFPVFERITKYKEFATIKLYEKEGAGICVVYLKLIYNDITGRAEDIVARAIVTAESYHKKELKIELEHGLVLHYILPLIDKKGLENIVEYIRKKAYKFADDAYEILHKVGVIPCA